MNRLLTILLLSLLTGLTFAEKRALVIGIGAYPDVDYGWHTINGDNDILLAVEMLQCNCFQRSNILTLANEQATYAGITAALQTLIRQSQTGDIIYIHFSGHGQLITDLNGDEQDGYDEAWIPYDALQEPADDYHGERHLIDDELNGYLHQLRQRVGNNGQVIVVADACHSGTSTRFSSDEAVIRGSSAKFIISGQKSRFPLPQSVAWIAISACADKECNRQTITDTGLACGSLTYALYLLRNSLATIALDDLANQLKAKLQPPFVSRPQSPQMECPDTAKKQPLFR